MGGEGWGGRGVNKLTTGKKLMCKLKDSMSNSVDLDETAHHEPAHLVLCCLQKPIIIACDSERVIMNGYTSYTSSFLLHFQGKQPLIT